MTDQIKNILGKSLELKGHLLENSELHREIEAIVHLLVETFKADRKVLFCGNGGSAADAQHLAAELSGRYYINRPALFAEALHVNTSFLTAVGNDFDFSYVYARAVEAMGRKGDVLFALSTSGNSRNIVEAILAAKKLDMMTVGMTGMDGGRMAGHCNRLIRIPSDDTPRIQEAHMLVGHIICELTEKALFS